MDVFDYIEKELDRIEVGYTSYDGTRLTMSIDDVRELIENLRKKLAQNLPNTCTDPIEREDVINILHDAMQGRSESEENLIGEIVSKVDLLPSTQPKTEERTEKSAQYVPNKDLISKKATIDVIKKSRFLVDAMEKVIKLPPAQPEMVKCKKCRYVYYDEEFDNFWCNRMSDSFKVEADGYCKWGK